MKLSYGRGATEWVCLGGLPAGRLRTPPKPCQAAPSSASQLHAPRGVHARAMKRNRLALAALVVELTILWSSRGVVRNASDDVYWWLWSVVPMPDGVERPQRPHGSNLR